MRNNKNKHSGWVSCSACNAFIFLNTCRWHGMTTTALSWFPPLSFDFTFFHRSQTSHIPSPCFLHSPYRENTVPTSVEGQPWNRVRFFLFFCFFSSFFFFFFVNCLTVYVFKNVILKVFLFTCKWFFYWTICISSDRSIIICLLHTKCDKDIHW